MRLIFYIPVALTLSLLLGLPVADAAPTLSQPITLTAPEDESGTGDQFGAAVALDGDFMVVGAPGLKSVYVHERDGDYVTTLAPLDVDGGGFGSVVDISGDTIVIGASRDNSFTGAVYVSTYDGADWSLPVKLAPPEVEQADNFGKSVAIDGDTFVVGATGDDDNGGSSGAVYVYERDGNIWVNTDKLFASDPEQGDFFGWDVAIDGTRLIAGAREEGDRQGAVYIFDNVNGAWTFTAKLAADDATEDSVFGAAVSLSGEQAFIGALGADNDAGKAYSFVRYTNGAWVQTDDFRDATTSVGDTYGTSAAVDGMFALVGAPQNFGRGAAYFLQNDRCAWTRFEFVSGGAAGDGYGAAVALDSGTAVIGKPGNTGAVDVYTFDTTLPPTAHTIAVGDTAGLIDAIHCANSTPLDDVIQLTNSTYTLTEANNTVGGSGANGLPAVGSAGGALTLNGNGATVERDDSVPTFRLLTVMSGAQLTLQAITLRNGDALIVGGALRNQGDTTIETSVIADSSANGYGGGIYNDGGNLTLSQSTVSGNTAAAGGGVYTINGALTVTNTTFYGNSATDGSGIDSYGDTVLLNSTLRNNTASGDSGGVRGNSGTFTMTNTLLNNVGGDCSGNVTGDSNLITGANTCTGLTNTVTGDPILGALTTAPNGTQYYPLLLGSPAINTGNTAAVTDTGLTQDQTGAVRVVAGTVDIGAAEYQGGAVGPDVNGDGFITAVDAIYVINRIGTDDLTADVNGDNAINADDAQAVIERIGS